jgi:hypothetical protein
MTTVVLKPSDYTHEGTADALNRMFTWPHGPRGEPDAWIDPNGRTVLIGARKFFAARLEYDKDLDLAFLTWLAGVEQARGYVDLDDARADALDGWARQLTDEYFGSPYVGGLESQYAESLVHHSAGGTFFRYDDETYLGLWSWNLGQQRTCSRPLIFQVMCDPASLPHDEHRAEVFCGQREATWAIVSREVRLEQVAGEEPYDTRPVPLDVFASDTRCRRCPGDLFVDMVPAV